jgi:fatty-acyl-CoA synthase
MADVPLTLDALLRRGATVFGTARVHVADGDATRSWSFREVADEAARLAAALRALGTGPGDRVATMCWNVREHLVAYLAVPAMGAVLHTVNIRLAADELAHILDRGGATVLVVDGSLSAVVLDVLARVPRLRTVIVIGSPDRLAAEADRDVLAYEDLLGLGEGAEADAWAQLDERSPSIICFTSGTTGLPKGVVYSHRSVMLHTLAISGGNAYAFSALDRVLTVVPMFHANAWGLPHAAWYAGADVVLPGRDLSGAALGRLWRATRPTVSSGVATVWDDLLRTGGLDRADVADLRLLVGGGSAIPTRLIERFEEQLGVRLIQGWGLTETSPLAAIGTPEPAPDRATDLARRPSAGRLVSGMDIRVVDDRDAELPGGQEGHIELRGPWVTAAYLDDPAPERFHDGWLRTGDIGSVTPDGFVHISDRAKDLIKSGGEWIVSARLEDALLRSSGVKEAAVVAIPDERWQERPAAWLVVDGEPVPDDELARRLRADLGREVPRWWLPDRWLVTNTLPRTSVGKIDKRRLREVAARLVEHESREVLSHEF